MANVIRTNIKSYSTPHDKGTGGVTYITGNVSNAALPDNVSINSIDAMNGNIDYLQGKTMTYNAGQFIDVGSSNGTIDNLSGNNIVYDAGTINDLTSDTIETGKLKADEVEIDKATINQVMSSHITTDYLTVTKQAHFFELIIDKIKSVGGTIIETATNCVIDWVKAFNSSNQEVALDANNVQFFDAFWRVEDGTGRQLTNDWYVYDQAICQSFTNVSTGANFDVSNKYYWRLVESVLADVYVNFDNGSLTSNASDAQVNKVNITKPVISYVDAEGATQTMSKGLVAAAQTTSSWATASAPWWGTMTTSDTEYGIELTIDETAYSSSDTYRLTNVIPTHLTFSCYDSRLNITVYYSDGTTQYFPASNASAIQYSYDLTADSNISKIVITNANDPNWHLCHRIRLSNTSKDSDRTGFSSIPTAGDHLVQLGYRWDQANDSAHKTRSNAIIIAAYSTPDSQITPPSYAQYEGIAATSGHRFELSRYRKTYMDSVGAKFVGDFEAGNGQDIVLLISQTANQILLDVGAAGVNVQDGTITLNADTTTINGGLNLYGGDQGLSIYDANGYEKISLFPDNISGLISTISQTDDHKIRYAYKAGARTYNEAQAYNSNGTVSFIAIPIGTTEAGQTVKVNQIEVRVNADTHPTLNYTWTLYANGTQIGTSTGTVTYNRQGYVIGGISVQSNITGNVTLSLTLTTTDGTNPYNMQVWAETISSNLSKIGQDGAVLAKDSDDFNWLGPTSTVISHGTSQLSIDTTGIFNNGADIGGYVNNVILTSANTSGLDPSNVHKYEASLKDTLIVATDNMGHDTNIYIPSAVNCPGKVYYIKNISSYTVKVYASSIIASDSTATSTYVSVANRSYMLIATDAGWITFKSM